MNSESEARFELAPLATACLTPSRRNAVVSSMGVPAWTRSPLLPDPASEECLCFCTTFGGGRRAALLLEALSVGSVVLLVGVSACANYG